jgi:phosphatidylserine decarboxylase
MSRVRAGAERVATTLVSSPLLSRATGWLSDRRLPGFVLRPVLRAYVRAYGVDVDEALLPLESYPTFNAFFTRRLREGRRPVCREPNVVVAPCDARLSSIDSVPASGRLEAVKGRDYSIEALLGSAEEARPFRDGVGATLYLSPAMYHRVHSPVDGCVRAWRYVPGRLFPVNRAGVRAIPGLFTRNERVAVFCDTDPHGPVAVVMVGAANVGRMSLAFAGLVTNRGGIGAREEPQAPVPLARGDDLGAFNLGSTVVLLVADPTLVAAARAGDLVRMGQPLWRASR